MSASFVYDLRATMETVGLLEFVNSTSILITVVLILACTFITRQVTSTKFRSTSLKNPPPNGPKEWPIIGGMLSLIGDEPYIILAGMSAKYGPVFCMRIGSIRTLVLNDYASIREAFARSGDDFCDRPKLGMMEKITQGRGIILAHVGESQRERRRFGLAALRSLGMGKSRLVENIVAEIETLSELFASRNGEPFVPFHDLTVSVSNIILWIVFGKRFRHDDPELRDILGVFSEGLEICESTGALNFFPFLEYLPLPVWYKISRNEKKYETYIRPLVAEVLERGDSDAPCFIQMFADEMNQNNTDDSKAKKGSGSDENAIDFDEKNLFQTIGDLFVAGTDTTATTLKWGLLYMVLNPDVQEKVHNELDKVFGPTRMPRLQDRLNIPYTEAVLMEVQRMATIVPFAVPHSTAWDTRLNGYDIPGGTFIMPNIWAVHYDPDVWDEPEVFKPERFLNQEGNAVIQREELIPFCTGRRKCLGEQLAKMELFLFFTRLLHRFEFRLPEGALPPTTKGRPGITRNPPTFDICAVAPV